MSRAFDDWQRDESELQLFFDTALRLARTEYETIWKELGEQPSNGEGPELGDLFDDATGGMNSYLFEILLSSMILREAVTLFELYFDGLFRELGVLAQPDDETAKWSTLVQLSMRYLGFDPGTKRISDLRALRNNLTHLRGELRSEEQRQRFPTSDLSLHTHAEIDETVTNAALRSLAYTVRRAEVHLRRANRIR